MLLLELVAYRVEVENSKVAPLFFLALQVRYNLTNDYEKLSKALFWKQLKVLNHSSLMYNICNVFVNEYMYYYLCLTDVNG